MSEKQLSLPEIFLIVFDFVIVGVVIFFLILLLLNFRVEIKGIELQRTTEEIAENLLVSPLASTKFVFDKTELDKFDKTDTEPYVRHCNYAYRLKIEAKKKISDKDEWNFGYKTNQFAHANRLGDFDFETPVSLRGTDEKGNVLVVPGKMKITVYDTIVGRVDCIIETAFYTKEIQKIPVPCSSDKGRFCELAIDKKPENICFVTDYRKFGRFSDPDTECRRIDPNIVFTGISYSFEKDDKKRFLNAVPLTTMTDPVLLKIMTNPAVSCNEVEQFKASKTDAIAGAALCLEVVK